MALVEYTTMRRVLLLATIGLAFVGCVTPVVLENPATRQRVNCTLEAERLAYDTPTADIGTDVPQPRRPTAALTAFDLEQQCVGNLLREGFVCVAGCKPPSR
jgi:hypothetical protein